MPREAPVTIATFCLEVITVPPVWVAKDIVEYPPTCQCQDSEESIAGFSKKCCTLFLSCGVIHLRCGRTEVPALEPLVHPEYPQPMNSVRHSWIRLRGSGRSDSYPMSIR